MIGRVCTCMIGLVGLCMYVHIEGGGVHLEFEVASSALSELMVEV